MVEQAQNVLETYTLGYEVHDWRSIYTARIRLVDFAEKNRSASVWQDPSVI
jgi:hypothetical protein